MHSSSISIQQMVSEKKQPFVFIIYKYNKFVLYAEKIVLQ